MRLPGIPAHTLPARAHHLDVEVADLLAQRVAVDAEQVGGADLVTAGSGERGREQRVLDLAQDAVIEAGRRHAVGEAGEIAGEMALDGRAKALLAARLLGRG